MFFLQDLPTRQMIDGYVSQAKTGDAATIAQALAMMRQASQLVRRLDAYFLRHNLSQLKFLILVVIDREPERTSLRQSEINARLDVSKPVLHRTVAALMAADFLVRLEDGRDGRAHLLALTPKGAEKLAQVLPGYFDVITGFMEA